MNSNKFFLENKAVEFFEALVLENMKGGAIKDFATLDELRASVKVLKEHFKTAENETAETTTT